MWIWCFAPISLIAQQERGGGRHDRCREAGAAAAGYPTARLGAENVLPWSHQPAGAIRTAPVAEVYGPVPPIECADSQHHRQSGRNMETLAPVVAGGGDDENIAAAAQTNGILQPGVRLSRVGQLTAADVDDMCAVIDGQLDRARQIQL